MVWLNLIYKLRHLEGDLYFKRGNVYLLHPAVQDQIPEAMEKPKSTVDPLITPFQILSAGAKRQKSRTVSAVFLNQGIGIHDIAFGLGHLRPVFNHHPLGVHFQPT